MPRNRTTDRWEHPTYRYAFVREYRGMACTVIHGGPPISTGYPWKRSNRDAALKVLDERLLAFKIGQKSVDIRDQSTVTCKQLWEEFRTVRQSKVTTSRWYMLQRAFGFVPPNALVKDTVIIRNHVRKAVAKKEYGINTEAGIYKAIRSVFAFAIEHGWCTVNPIHKDMVPTAVDRDPEPYTAAEISSGIEGSRERYKPFLRFLVATGCRPIEAVRLTWADVKDDGVYVRSKKGGSQVWRTRVLPYALCDGLAEVVAALDRGPDSTKVFGMNSYVKAATSFAEALGDANRGLYPIRQFTINKWKRLGYPDHVRHVLAGHEKTIAEKSYETPYTSSELVRLALDSMPEKGIVFPLKTA